MDFDLNDLSIFEPLFKKRPEVIPEKLEVDLEKYYLPYAKKLIELKKQKGGNEGILVGVSAIQGVGKTTQGEILEILMEHFGYSTDSLSIDDHYITHKELCELRNSDPRYIRRGVTHDIPLAMRDLKKMKEMEDGKPFLISGYDKGLHHGDGDRLRWINMTPDLTLKAKVVTEDLMVSKQMQNVKALQLVSVNFKGEDVTILDDMGSDIPLVEPFLPANLLVFLNEQSGEITVTQNIELGMVDFKGIGEVSVDKKDLPHAWRLINKKPGFIFYDGWMLGARPQDESVFEQNLPALETPEDKQFARDVNKKLANYEQLWNLFDFLNVLFVPDFQISVKWRDQAEEALRAKGEGMTHDQIVEFVHYFWRSVHPAIHIKALAHDETHTDQVVIINDDHSVEEILTPVEAKTKYP